MKFKLNQFSGIAPKIAPELLPAPLATVAENCKLFSGQLDSWFRPKEIAKPSKADQGTVQTIFRMSNGATDYWLNWLADVNCVRGPIASDTSQRIYYTGDGEPRVSDFSLATAGSDLPSSWYVLGVPAPKTAPTVGHTGGSAANVTRAYVYTFVSKTARADGTTLDEEGGPSPPSTYTAPSDATWNISGLETAPPNAGTVSGATHASGFVTVTLDTNRHLRAGENIKCSGVGGMTDLNGTFKIEEVIGTNQVKVKLTTAQTYTSGGTWERVAPHNVAGMKKRIYRVATGSAGAQYQFVAEIDAAATSYNDTIADSALGEVLPSSDPDIAGSAWDMPPTDLHGLIEVAEGVLAGFSKNQVCFCEPYQPHAWPARYRKTASRDIVGIGAYDGGAVVCTQGNPYVITGATPEAMTFDPVKQDWPCLSKRGIVSFPFGVLYPSKDGFALIGHGGTLMASADVFTRDEFKSYYPETLLAVAFRGRYFGWYSSSADAGKGVIFDLTGQGQMLVQLGQHATAAYVDPETNELYIVHENLIKQWDGDTLNRLPYDWQSKLLVAPKDICPGAAKVDAEWSLLDEIKDLQAQKDKDTASNQAILAGSETWPEQGITRGAMNESMVNEFMVNGSLLQGGDLPEFDQRYVIFYLYAYDDEARTMALKHSVSVTDGKEFRLPKGYLSTDFQVRILSNIKVRSVEVAETMDELRQV